jgi:hypothetical protein
MSQTDSVADSVEAEFGAPFAGEPLARLGIECGFWAGT